MVTLTWLQLSKTTKTLYSHGGHWHDINQWNDIGKWDHLSQPIYHQHFLTGFIFIDTNKCRFKPFCRYFHQIIRIWEIILLTVKTMLIFSWLFVKRCKGLEIQVLYKCLLTFQIKKLIKTNMTYSPAGWSSTPSIKEILLS